MWRRAVRLLHQRPFSSTSEIPTLHSFLQPSIFAVKKSPSSSPEPTNLPIPPPKTLSTDHKTDLESTLYKSIITSDTDEAWKSFKTLTGNSAFPNQYAIPINGTCHERCGTISVKFPFGTGFGCGHPDFSRYVKCSSGILQFSTGTGNYDISSIDYTSNNVILSDPLMSTCASMQNSGSFSLDRASPFTMTSDNIFVLLGCSKTSPVFDPNADFCDTGSGSRLCKGLYSCKGVSGIGLQQNAPTSTCCVYDSPMGLGLAFTLDLPQLQCSSYTSINGYGDDEGDPMKWNFGISLRYNGSHYSDTCKECEASGGLCGFAAADESFSCICRNGLNTTTNCIGRGYAWSGTHGLIFQTQMSIIGGIFLSWMLIFI